MSIDLSKLITADDKLQRAKQNKLQELSSACRSQILAGFVCDALGSEHLYPTNETDQQNLTASVLDSLVSTDSEWTTPFWCADSSDVWEFRLHTKAQIQQVGQDAKQTILGLMDKNAMLAGQVAQAETPEALEAIAW